MTRQEEREGRARRTRVLRKLEGLVGRLEHDIDATKFPEAEQFEHLSVALESRSKLRRAYHRPELAFAGIVIGAATLIAFLQLTRVRDTEATITVAATAVEFTAGSDERLVFPRVVQSATASGLTHVDAPTVDGETKRYEQLPEEDLAIKLVSHEGGRLVLQPIQVRRGTRLNLAFTSGRAVLLDAANLDAEMQASILGQVRVAVRDSDESAERSPSVVRAWSKKNFGVTVKASSWDDGLVFAPFRIEDLRLADDRRGTISDVELGSVPTVVSGRIRMAEVPVTYDLNRGERLAVNLVREKSSEIREIRVDAEKRQFLISIRAWVRSIEVGSESSPIELQPTRLEWLRAQHGPEFAWVTFVGLIGALSTLRSWMKHGKE